MTVRRARSRRVAASRLISTFLLAGVAGGSTFLPGCSPSKAPLAHAQPSGEAMAQAVLDALERRDRQRLLELALDEREFREHVWPELPASRPERNLPLEYVWGDLKQKSEASLAQTLHQYGGVRLRLVRLEFTGETTQYDSFVVRRDSQLAVIDAEGREQRVRVFGSMLTTGDGRVKVFSYVVD
jgi:hypothetical protein